MADTVTRKSFEDMSIVSESTQDPIIQKYIERGRFEEPVCAGLWGDIFNRGGAFETPNESLGTLSRLPLETRLNIYAFLMADFPKSLLVWEPSFGNNHGRLRRHLFNDMLCASKLPSLSFTSRQILYEIMLVYLRHTRLVLTYCKNGFSQMNRVASFLCHFPPTKASTQ
jgi:hypothetical protein